MLWPLTLSLTHSYTPHSLGSHKASSCSSGTSHLWSLLTTPFCSLSHRLLIETFSNTFSNTISIILCLWPVFLFVTPTPSDVALYSLSCFCLPSLSSRRLWTPRQQGLSLWYTSAFHSPAPRMRNAWHSEGLHKNFLNGVVKNPNWIKLSKFNLVL